MFIVVEDDILWTYKVNILHGIILKPKILKYIVILSYDLVAVLDQKDVFIQKQMGSWLSRDRFGGDWYQMML